LDTIPIIKLPEGAEKKQPKKKAKIEKKIGSEEEE